MEIVIEPCENDEDGDREEHSGVEDGDEDHRPVDVVEPTDTCEREKYKGQMTQVLRHRLDGVHLGSHVAWQSLREHCVDDDLLQTRGHADHDEGKDYNLAVRVVHQEEGHCANCSHAKRDHELVAKANLVGKETEEGQKNASACKVDDLEELVDVPGVLPDHLVVL